MTGLKKRNAIAVAALNIALATSVSVAQEIPAVPPTPTLWSFLGIPQGLRKVRGAMLNRRGNFPRLERRPPLKALADPANFAKDMPPAIRKAAEMKKAEDMKGQKIKAIKFLTKMGCGCYDKGGEITAALINASEDCTEDVRLTTIKEVGEAAEGECCANCGEVCCCSEDIVMQMAKIAYERDDQGCYVEPSERVREAAIEVLEICCPDDSPIVEMVADDVLGEDEDGEGVIRPEETEGEENGEGDSGAEDASNDVAVDDASDENDAQVAASVRTPSELMEGTTAAIRQFDEPWNEDDNVIIHGTIVRVNAAKSIAHIHFDSKTFVVPVKTRLATIASAGNSEDVTVIGEVYQSFPGSVNVRFSPQTDMRWVNRGMSIVLVHNSQVARSIARASLSESQQPVPFKRIPIQTVSDRNTESGTPKVASAHGLGRFFE